jgi:hypothetical protein
MASRRKKSRGVGNGKTYYMIESKSNLALLKQFRDKLSLNKQ